MSQEITTIAQQLEQSRTEAPSEVIVTADGGQHVIQWQGTPASRKWVTRFLDGLTVARLIEPFPEVPQGIPEAQRRVVQARIDQRLDEWHKVLAGMPMEALVAAGQHFRNNGVPDGRWGYLKPSDLSRWIRPRLRRRIPTEKACETHPDEWAHSCTLCDYEGPVAPEKARQYLAQIRAGLATRKDTP